MYNNNDDNIITQQLLRWHDLASHHYKTANVHKYSSSRMPVIY